MLAMLWGWDQAHKHAKFWIKSETGIFGQHLNLMFWTNYESRLRHLSITKRSTLMSCRWHSDRLPNMSCPAGPRTVRQKQIFLKSQLPKEEELPICPTQRGGGQCPGSATYNQHLLSCLRQLARKCQPGWEGQKKRGKPCVMKNAAEKSFVICLMHVGACTWLALAEQRQLVRSWEIENNELWRRVWLKLTVLSQPWNEKKIKTKT